MVSDTPPRQLLKKIMNRRNVNNRGKHPRKKPKGNTRKNISNNSTPQRDPFTNHGYNYSYKGSGRRDINVVSKGSRLVSGTKATMMDKAYRHWLNPFSYPIVRHPLASGEPTALYEKRMVVTVPTTGTGAASVRVSIDADLLYSIEHNTGVITPATLHTGTWTPLSTSTAVATEGIWITNITIRFKYIGPVVNRGGLCYHVQNGPNGGSLDIAQAPNDPFGFIIPIDDKYIYARSVNHNRYKRDTSETGVNSLLYCYFTGLPNTSSCIQAELYISAEFLPTPEMRPYVQVSHLNRMTVAENMMFEAAITQPKASQKAHENGEPKDDSKSKGPSGTQGVTIDTSSNGKTGGKIEVDNGGSTDICIKTPLQNCLKAVDKEVEKHKKWKKRSKQIITATGTAVSVLEATRRAVGRWRIRREMPADI